MQKHRNIRLVLLIALFMSVCCYTLTQSPSAHAQTDEESSAPQEYHYEFKLNNIAYSGTYTGDLRAGKPFGDGEFVTDERSPKQFTYKGSFENGLFDGKGTILCPNGDRLKCRFSAGLPQGWATLTHTDGSYTTIRYSSIGIPYSVSSTYAADSDELISYDFYYNGELVSFLEECAATVEYRELYQNQELYFGDVLKIHGKVLNVYETNNSCIFKIADEQENLYWGKYLNIQSRSYNQAIMPTLKTGDMLTLCGFFHGIQSYSCPNDPADSNFSYPELAPVCAALDTLAFDRRNPSYEYEEVLRFPYHYLNLEDTITGQVERLAFDSQNEDIVYLKIADTDKNSYYISVKISDETLLPVPGDAVQISGLYRGLYKEYHENAPTDLFVFLKSTSVSILE